MSLYLFKMMLKTNGIQNIHFIKQNLRDINLGQIQIYGRKDILDVIIFLLHTYKNSLLYLDDGFTDGNVMLCFKELNCTHSHVFWSEYNRNPHISECDMDT